MKNTSLLILLSTATLWLTSCYKDSPTDESPYQPIDYSVLPPITQTGANTFGCLVNGEVWVPRVPLFSWTLYDKAFSFDESKGLGYGNGDCTVANDSTYQVLALAFGASHYLPTEYHTTSDSTYINAFSVWFKDTHSKWYLPDETATLTSNRFIISKIDTTKNFISGTFEFTLYNTLNKNDSIVITDGRFDLLYNPQ